ncbi:DUF1254 domain-containing protein [Vibrio ouci]|uniref:DUF1254 domain-containing protein n=1 Tax=Vibrio ouci TaxID=2499078 RepID=A0A4Y8WJL8_9VIBR|nr:DUF1254 domain-containing protein [Vibrio ouci]TFH93137.1 DUF1254 domain-containing protein [Vibrio ouci]
MRKSILALSIATITSFGALAPVHASVENQLEQQALQAQEIEQTRFLRRAVEAGHWIMPQVMYDAMATRAIEDFNGDDLTVFYYSRPMNEQAQVVTGNNNSPYVHLYHDLAKHDAVVVELPEATNANAFFGTFLDSWHKPIADVGPDGEDKGAGGKYLLIGPNFKGEVPQGYFPIHYDTYRGYLSMRSLTATTSDEDMDRHVEYVQKIKVYPYGEKHKQTQHIDWFGKLYDATIKFDMSYWEVVNQRIQDEVIKADEKAFYGMMKSLGIEKGQEFNPTPEQVKFFEQATLQLHQEVQHDVATYAPRLWGDKAQWTLPVPRTMMTTEATYVDPSWNDYQSRGTTFYFYFAPPASLADSKSTTYIKNGHDENGLILNGDFDYQMTVQSDVPAKRFWSALTYSTHTGAYVIGADTVGIASNEPATVFNDDGTATLNWSANCEGKVNCMEVNKGEEFFLLFRLYGPETNFFNGQFVLNDLEKIDS